VNDDTPLLQNIHIDSTVIHHQAGPISSIPANPDTIITAAAPVSYKHQGGPRDSNPVGGDMAGITERLLGQPARQRCRIDGTHLIGYFLLIGNCFRLPV